MKTKKNYPVKTKKNYLVKTKKLSRENEKHWSRESEKKKMNKTNINAEEINVHVDQKNSNVTFDLDSAP